MEKKPTEAELEVLQVLWENGSSSVRFVNETLSKNREVVYTTTLKIMQNMTEKGFLKRDASKRTHLYEAAISEAMVQEKFFDRFLDKVFGGSPLKLVLHTLGHEKTKSDDLEEIKKLISKLEKNTKK